MSSTGHLTMYKAFVCALKRQVMFHNYAQNQLIGLWWLKNLLCVHWEWEKCSALRQQALSDRFQGGQSLSSQKGTSPIVPDAGCLPLPFF